MEIVNIEERNVFTKEIYIYTKNLQIEVYLTFIDDIFYIGKEDIDIFETINIDEHLQISDKKEKQNFSIKNNSKEFTDFENISEEIREKIYANLKEYDNKNIKDINLVELKEKIKKVIENL